MARFLLALLVIGAAGALGGCGYKPLVAPCSMDEGAGPRAPSAREEAPSAPSEPPVQTLYFAEPERPPAPGPFGSFGAGDDCGPLRPINSGRLR